MYVQSCMCYNSFEVCINFVVWILQDTCNALMFIDDSVTLPIEVQVLSNTRGHSNTSRA